MKIPMHKPTPAIDFMPFMEMINEKYGFNYHDFAGKFSREARAENAAHKSAWMNENGFSGMEHVLDFPDKTKHNVDWPKDSEEIAMRVAINSGYAKYAKAEALVERPYQNFWHWYIDGTELRRGGFNYMGLDGFGFDGSEVAEWVKDTPDWVVTILKAIYTEVKDNDAFDGETVTFYIDW